MSQSDIVVEQLTLRRRSRVLEVAFSDGSHYQLPFEYLRVHSPSAEVQGHGPGEGVLVVGKQSVDVRAIEPVGQYAIRLVFDDGHDTGLYTWAYLRELAVQQTSKWADYQARVARSGQGGSASQSDQPQ